MDSNASVVIERQLHAPVAKVFHAWTDPASLAQWFRSSEALTVELAEVDLRVGGQYRIAIGDGTDTMVVFGSYSVVEPPTRLEFTWQWEVSSIEPGETRVLLELTPNEEGTLLRLTHSRFSSPTSFQAHDKGWNGVLVTLASFVASETSL